MKKLIKSFTLIFIMSMGINMLPKESDAQVSVSFQMFYDNLSPYGYWTNYPKFGYVWIPNVGPGFMPYSTAGHWEWTMYGWLWVSDYPWGWAPFHYGRWAYDNFYGWFWVPGREWGPAWVCWRNSPGYYGWAPLAPGISLTVAFSSGYHIPVSRWVFVKSQYINSPRMSDYYAGKSNVADIYTHSTIINNTYVDNSRNTTYVTGPHREDVQNITGNSINQVNIMGSTVPMGSSVKDGQLEMYRPEIQKPSNNAVKPAPKKVVPLKEVKPLVTKDIQQNNNHLPPNTSIEKNMPVKEQNVNPKINNEQPQMQQKVQPLPNSESQKNVSPNIKQQQVHPTQEPKMQQELSPVNDDIHQHKMNTKVEKHHHHIRRHEMIQQQDHQHMMMEPQKTN